MADEQHVVIVQVRAAKSEYESPEPMSLEDAEQQLTAITAGDEADWVDLAWLKVRRRDVVAARRVTDAHLPRTPEVALARLAELLGQAASGAEDAR